VRKVQDQEVQVGSFFSSFAETWDALYGGKRSLLTRVIDKTLRRDIYERYQLTFEKLGPDLSGRTVLDIGCGSGVYCFEAVHRGAKRVLGVDLSQGMIDLALHRMAQLDYEEKCEFVCSPFPPQSLVGSLHRQFDVAIIMGVMDYVAEPSAFMQAVRNAITDYAIFSFPGEHWLRAPLRVHRYRLLGRCAVYNYSEHTIRELSSNAGFRTSEVRVLNHSGICYIVTAYV